MASIALFLAASYAVLAVVLARHADARTARPPRSDFTPTISVLVAARNEAERLGACLEALRQQSYPPDHIEIIVADDHSTDGTADVARRHGVHCVRLRSEEPTGKAAALHAAFEISRGSVLLVTDADCRPPRDWARNLTAQFDTPRAGIVCGVTSIRDGGLLARLQAFDWALLLTVAAGLSAIGKPLTAMGNNMAIRREAYLAVGGYPALPDSVTEDYALFRAVAHRTSFDVELLLDAALENRTEPLSRLRDVVAQRRRWALGGLRSGPGGYLFYLFVWCVHAAIVAGLIAAPPAGLLALGIKTAADARILYEAGRNVRLNRAWAALPAFEAYLFAYVLLMPLSLLARPSTSWRGRTYTR